MKKFFSKHTMSKNAEAKSTIDGWMALLFIKDDRVLHVNGFSASDVVCRYIVSGTSE
jgi:hypothetical protein